MTFRAVRADKTEAGQTVRFVDMEDADLMDGDVTIRVTHSTVNYKDGLALSRQVADHPQLSDGARRRSRRRRRNVAAGRTSRPATR